MQLIEDIKNLNNNDEIKLMNEADYDNEIDVKGRNSK
jgi:hypothetical protein